MSDIRPHPIDKKENKVYLNAKNDNQKLVDAMWGAEEVEGKLLPAIWFQHERDPLTHFDHGQLLRQHTAQASAHRAHCGQEEKRKIKIELLLEKLFEANTKNASQ